MGGQLISPQATGGAGTIFEYRVAAVMLSRLIRAASAPVGFQVRMFRVGFQQRNAGYPLDDIVAHALPRDGSPALRIQFQVKKRIGITAHNREFREVIAAAIESCGAYADEVKRGDLLFGLAAGESAAQPADLDDLAHLTELARGNGALESFKRQLQKGATRERRRVLFDNVSAAVAAEAATDDPTLIDRLTHEILLSLHVWHVFPEDDGGDWRTELDALSGLAAQAGMAAPDLMAHLCNLAAFFEKHGGLLSASDVRRQMRSSFGVDLPLPDQGFGRQLSGINVVNYGNGHVFAADSQVFNIHIGSNPSWR
jgi:hypothetical protein